MYNPFTIKAAIEYSHVCVCATEIKRMEVMHHYRLIRFYRDVGNRKQRILAVGCVSFVCAIRLHV